jgi:hypothetical protein
MLTTGTIGLGHEERLPERVESFAHGLVVAGEFVAAFYDGVESEEAGVGWRLAVREVSGLGGQGAGGPRHGSV